MIFNYDNCEDAKKANMRLKLFLDATKDDEIKFEFERRKYYNTWVITVKVEDGIFDSYEDLTSYLRPLIIKRKQELRKKSNE
jgi:hypothetical protein